MTPEIGRLKQGSVDAEVGVALYMTVVHHTKAFPSYDLPMNDFLSLEVK